MLFKGREIIHKDVGINIIAKFKTEILNFTNKIELDMKKEEKSISITITPK